MCAYASIIIIFSIIITIELCVVVCCGVVVSSSSCWLLVVVVVGFVVVFGLGWTRMGVIDNVIETRAKAARTAPPLTLRAEKWLKQEGGGWRV